MCHCWFIIGSVGGSDSVLLGPPLHMLDTMQRCKYALHKLKGFIDGERKDSD